MRKQAFIQLNALSLLVQRRLAERPDTAVAPPDADRPLALPSDIHRRKEVHREATRRRFADVATAISNDGGRRGEESTRSEHPRGRCRQIR